MKTEHLEGRITDYKKSIETVIEKKILWKTKIKSLLVKTLQDIVKKHTIGWCVQELNWIGTNEAVNITFESFNIGPHIINNEIHFDFELDNIVWNTDKTGIIDFDDSAFYWFVADIAFALRDLYDDSVKKVELQNESFELYKQKPT